MVLITRYLPSVIENNVPSIENVTSKDQIIDAVLQNSTVGIINQLMVLAGHANSIFSSLAQESTAITTRLNKLNSRLAPLVNMVPSIENYHAKTSIDVLNTKSRAEYHAENPEKHQLFVSVSVPQSVQTVYNEKCQAPPRLHLLDPYMDNNQKALKLYTNPDFFIDEWVAEQAKQREEARQRRRERKEARLKKKTEKPTDQSEVKKVKRVHKVRYDPVTGEKILIPVDSPVVTSTTATTSTHVSNLSMQPTVSNAANFPPPPPVAYNTPPPPTTSFVPPPPPPIDSFNIPPPPLSQSSSSAYSAPPPMAQAGSRMSVVQHSPPPPPPPAAPAPPPPPPPAVKSALASALEAGAGGLRPAEAKPKTVDARSDLMSSIVAGMALKPAEERKLQEPAPSKSYEPVNVAEILARRIAWAHSDSEDDDSDDDSDWD